MTVGATPADNNMIGISRHFLPCCREFQDLILKHGTVGVKTSVDLLKAVTGELQAVAGLG
jgi:hypothetical protein